MPNLTFDFVWYKDSKGYRLVPAPRLRLGQDILKLPVSDIRPARIVGNGGRLMPYPPLKIESLFKRFSGLMTAKDVLEFVEKFGPLTSQGLRGKGDIVLDVLAEAEHMRSGVRKALGKLLVSIDTIRDDIRLAVRPACLLDAIWLQYAQANTRARECPQCGQRFLSGVGTGRRAKADYCSDECRVKYNSLKRSRR